MKIITKTVTIFFISCVFLNTHAQKLSTVDKKIVKDIQSGIEAMAVTNQYNFESLINYGAGAIAKDINMILYKADYLEPMHADEYYVFNYFIDSLNIYCCNYTNKVDVLLAEKAIKDLVKYQPKKWKLLNGKSVPDKENVHYLLCNNKKIAQYKKVADNTFLQIGFIEYYKNDVTENFLNTKANNNTDEFLSDTNKKLREIDTQILKTDSIKIIEIQQAIANILEQGKNWFEKNIATETNRDATAIYYHASITQNMYAQEYKGKTMISENAMYYLCSYTSASNITIAMAAIDDLPALKNSKWMILKFIDNNSYTTQKLYLDGQYVGYTSYLKTIKQFDIYLKKN